MELRKGIMQKAFLRVKERFNIMKQFEAYMPNKKVSKAHNTYVKRQWNLNDCFPKKIPRLMHFPL